MKKVVLVTGASRGLGAASAAEFGRAGWRVAVNYRSSRAAAEGVAAEIAAAGGEAFCCRADIASAGEVGAMVGEIERRWGRLDVLVANAGIAHEAPCVSTREADWDAVLGTNLTGTFLCARAAAAAMLRGGAGHIITVGSILGVRGGRGGSAYAASKAALLGFTMSVARELGGSGIRANAVIPGFMPAGMGMSASPQARARAREESVLGRHADVAEAARFITVLAGMDGVSGQVFALDGRIHRWA